MDNIKTALNAIEDAIEYGVASPADTAAAIAQIDLNISSIYSAIGNLSDDKYNKAIELLNCLYKWACLEQAFDPASVPLADLIDLIG